jgi:predicted ATPase/DNA-binding winged helix-turn-helix (wHTH) protein
MPLHGITSLWDESAEPFRKSDEPVLANNQISASGGRRKRPVELCASAFSSGESASGATPPPIGQQAADFAFNGFRLRPAQRLLLNGDVPVRLGARALDLLIALVGRAGQVIGKQELTATIWPDTFVEEGNLKVQVSALRRALREDEAGHRYISTIAGRGYCFVAPVTVSTYREPAAWRAETAPPWHNLPTSLAPPVGRDDMIERIVGLSSRHRLVTLVGAGGVGKTSLALAAAEIQAAAYPDGIRFADMATLDDPLLVAPAVAAAFGLGDGADCAFSRLGDKRLLLVLDNCEHVVEAVAALAFRALRATPGLHILATSREPLHLVGEHIYRLPPLRHPPSAGCLSAREALAFPAVELFVDRTRRALGEFELKDADVPAVVDLCRKLDGVPLGIEFAAAEAAAFGIGSVAAYLDDPLRLPLHPRRAADPRHRSLRISIDWSHDLLTESEQTVFRRLAVLPGSFTLQAAAQLAADATCDDCELVDRIAALVSKSLLTLDADGSEPRFAMLHITRAYAIEKLREAGEAAAIGRRHAEYCRNRLREAA